MKCPALTDEGIGKGTEVVLLEVLNWIFDTSDSGKLC
jgi:hypothetical protein